MTMRTPTYIQYLEDVVLSLVVHAKLQQTDDVWKHNEGVTFSIYNVTDEISKQRASRCSAQEPETGETMEDHIRQLLKDVMFHPEVPFSLRDRILETLIKDAKAPDEEHIVQVMFVKVVDCTKKIACIKTVREHTGWGLKEAKEFVDTLPRSLNLKSTAQAESFVRAIRIQGGDAYINE